MASIAALVVEEGGSMLACKGSWERDEYLCVYVCVCVCVVVRRGGCKDG